MLGDYDADIGVDRARNVMSTIALATNTRGQRRPQAAPTPYHSSQPPFTPDHPFTPPQPFTIYQNSQNPASTGIRDDG